MLTLNGRQDACLDDCKEPNVDVQSNTANKPFVRNALFTSPSKTCQSSWHKYLHSYAKESEARVAPKM